MKIKNNYYRIGIISFSIFILSNAPFLNLNVNGIDFIKGLGAGIGSGFMILGILIEKNKLKEAKNRKRIIVNKIFH